jgi:hypothetical protein
MRFRERFVTVPDASIGLMEPSGTVPSGRIELMAPTGTCRAAP